MIQAAEQKPAPALDAGSGAPRLIHLADYKPPEAGSFVPFMHSVLSAAKDRGWDVEAVFPDEAQDRGWLTHFEQAGIPMRFFERSRRRLTQEVEELFAERQGATIAHTHFTTFDVPAALAARHFPNVHVFWHFHTVLSSAPRVVLANAVKLRTPGRGVEWV